jgi:hypothetical protein
MTEALWAQVISGFFGLATIIVSAYVPRRINRRNDHEQLQPEPQSKPEPPTKEHDRCP